MLDRSAVTAAGSSQDHATYRCQPPPAHLEFRAHTSSLSLLPRESGLRVMSSRSSRLVIASKSDTTYCTATSQLARFWRPVLVPPNCLTCFIVHPPSPRLTEHHNAGRQLAPPICTVHPQQLEQETSLSVSVATTGPSYALPSSRAGVSWFLLWRAYPAPRFTVQPAPELSCSQWLQVTDYCRPSIGVGQGPTLAVAHAVGRKSVPLPEAHFMSSLCGSHSSVKDHLTSELRLSASSFRGNPSSPHPFAACNQLPMTTTEKAHQPSWPGTGCQLLMGSPLHRCQYLESACPRIVEAHRCLEVCRIHQPARSPYMKHGRRQSLVSGGNDLQPESRLRTTSRG